MPLIFALLPDKSRRSYEDLFSGLKRALDARNLELSAGQFMSDFEHNIRESFKNNFEEIDVKGCYFHFRNVRITYIKCLDFIGFGLNMSVFADTHDHISMVLNV